MKYVLYALFIWFLYQFIFKLVIPVYRTSRKIKQGFREMQEKMQQQAGQYNSQQDSNTTSSKTNQVGDYIDFEEVK